VLAAGYTLVTGAQLATLRSLAVVALVLAGAMLDRPMRLADALGAAALALLAWRPADLHDPSFQLSFVAAMTLVYVTLGAALIHGARVRRRLRHLPVAGLAALVLITLHAIVDFSLQIPGVAVYAAAAIAAAVAVALGRNGEDGGGRRGLHNRAI